MIKTKISITDLGRSPLLIREDPHWEGGRLFLMFWLVFNVEAEEQQIVGNLIIVFIKLCIKLFEHLQYITV